MLKVCLCCLCYYKKFTILCNLLLRSPILRSKAALCFHCLTFIIATFTALAKAFKLENEEILAPCEIFAVTERIPQMLELIQDCHVLQTENPLKYEGIKSERLEKGSKLFYKYKVKQSKNYMNQDDSRVFYEIASGQWVSSTSAKGGPVLRRMVRVFFRLHAQTYRTYT